MTSVCYQPFLLNMCFEESLIGKLQYLIYTLGIRKPINLIFSILKNNSTFQHLDKMRFISLTAFPPPCLSFLPLPPSLDPVPSPPPPPVFPAAPGAGGLSLAVEGPSKAEISCHDNKDGTVSVSYLPTSPGEYKVSVKFADKHIKGSPYSVKVTGEGRKRNQISVGSQSEVSFPGKISDTDIKTLNASIQAPSGLEEPCFLKKLPNGHLGGWRFMFFSFFFSFVFPF